MGKFEDYIRAIDPTVELPANLLTDLQNAYTEDLALSEAKIASVETALADKDATITKLNGDLTTAKSHNYDLLLQVPKTVEEDTKPLDGETSINIDDLFGDNNDS
jgi:hypothetical protein